MAKTERDKVLIAVIDAAAETAYNADDSDQLAQDRSRAIDRYLGRNFDPAPEGRSQVRDRSVFETVEWIKPSLLRIFCATNEVAKFEAVGPEDEALAEQESDYINYVVTQRNPWYQIANDWFSDALIVKNGYVWAQWDVKKQVESEEYENLTPEGLTMLLQDQSVEVVDQTEKPDPETDQQNQAIFAQQMQQYQQMVMQAQMQSQMQPVEQPMPPPPQPPPPAYLYDITIRRKNEKGQVCLSVLPPEHCRIDVNTSSYTLDDCDYFEYFCEKSIGTLRAEGYDVPDDISSGGDDGDDSLEDQARDLYGEDQQRDDGGYSDDPSLRKVICRYIWVRHDYDGDGIAEMQYVVRVGTTILYRKEVVEIPVSSITPIPLAHRHIGMSMADVVNDIEDVNTAFTRQAIDNLFYSNNPRLAASDRVNMEDLLDSRPGGIIRIDGQPPQELMPVVVPDMFPSAVQALQFFDSRRMNRTGINAYFQGTDANVLNKTASGIAQLTSSAAQRVEMIARLFSFGVLRLFLIVHRLYIQHGHKAETVKLRNQWVQIDPSQWRRRTDVRLTVGLGTGNKDQQLAHLQAIMANQAQLGVPLGTVTPENVYHAQIEFAKAASFTNPELYYTNPKGQPPKPPQKEPAVQVAEIKAQVDSQKAQFDAQAKQQSDQQQQMFEKWKLEQQQAFERWQTEFNAQLQITLKGIDAQAQSELADKSARTTMESKAMDSLSAIHQSEQSAAFESEMDNRKAAREDSKDQQSAAQIGALSQQIGELAKGIEGKKAVGVEKVRDPKTGKMVGAKIKRSDGSTDEVTIQ